MKTLYFDINETQKLFGENRILELRGLSNRLIRESALNNDYAKAELGVIAYALHKIETKSHFVTNPKWSKIKQAILLILNDAEKASQENNSEKLIQSLKKIIKQITDVDNELGNYAQNLYEKAKVKQASLAYSYGLSISQASSLTGADQKELQNYVGFTTMHDEETEVKSIGERVKELKQLIENQ